jgi:hypothetical protein
MRAIDPFRRARRLSFKSIPSGQLRGVGYLQRRFPALIRHVGCPLRGEELRQRAPA